MTGNISGQGICAVVVTYQPEPALLEELLQTLRPQVEHILIFDNASTSVDLLDRLQRDGDSQLRVWRSPVNRGLGVAFNHGVDHARRLGCSHLLLMDQDSALAEGSVSKLLQALAPHGLAAAAGPQFVDVRTGERAPFVRIGFPFNRKLLGGPGQVIEVDFLISSGSLLDLAAIDRVGRFDEGLFIDNVDLEWSFRARAHGMALLGVCDAAMKHRIGDRRVHGWFKPGGVIVHSPLRLYYISRNRVLLYRRKETPRVWVAQDIPRLLLRIVGTTLFLKPRLAYLRAMLEGVRDGYRDITGKKREPSRRA